MNPFEAAKGAGVAWGEIWGRSGQSFLDVRRSLLETIAPNVAAGEGKTLPFADAEALRAAQASFREAWGPAKAMSEAFVRALEGSGENGQDPAAARVMARVFDPREWLTGTTRADEAVGRTADRLGPAELKDIERKLADLAAAWLTLRCRNLEHDTLMLEAWVRAAQRFTRVLEERAETAAAPGSARAFTELWAEIADETLRETQRGEAFLEGQRETLKASTDLRLAQQALGDLYARMFGFPTRAELDDVHRSLTELRREVRALTRASAGAGREVRIGEGA